MSDLSRKIFLAETAAVREHLAEQEQQATAEPAAAPAVVEPPADQTGEVRDQLLHAIDFNYAASLGYASPEELLAAYDTSRTPSAGQTTPSRRAGLRAELVTALGRITTVPPVAHRQEQADHVLAVLYREWPWLRAEAEDAQPSAGQTAARGRIAAAALAAVEAALGDTLVPAAREEALAGIVAVLPAATNHDTSEELTAEEAHALVDDLGLQLYRAQDALAFVGECCVIAEREKRAITTADVREWLKGAQCGRQLAAGDAELRRMADETATTQTQPRRGDAFEQWLKERRDEWAPDGCQPWQILDQALEEYRFHAETGTPLGEHVCEGQAVGDGECLEQPAAGARQDEPPRPSLRDQHRAAWHALSPAEQAARIAELDAIDEPAAGARQDGAQP